VESAFDIARVPRRPPRIDFVIAGVLLAWALLEALVNDGPGPRWLRVLVALAFTVPLVWRRRYPVAVMAAIAATVIAVALVADKPEPGAMPFPSLLIATFSVALHVRALPVAVAAGAIPIATMLFTVFTNYYSGDGPTPADVLILAFLIIGAWTAGRVVRHRAEQAVAAEATSGERAREAVSAERVRIARELHDVVAHSVSIIAVQAGAAEELVERDPSQARQHMAAVRRTAREALVEMRRLLGVLREDAATYNPQPGLARVEELLDDARAAGVPVELREEGERPATLAPGIDLAAYRIVQEALTNVRKHAGPVETTVTVRYGDDGIALEVVNAPGATGNGGGSGHGLAGMRERARVYGGTVEAGPDGGGGFAVRARLPVEKTE
jgi:signal transduction histidine kinase